MTDRPVKKFSDFYTAWHFLENHPIFQCNSSSMFYQCLEVDVIKVDTTGRINSNSKKNTTTRVWLECGPYIPAEKLRSDFERKLFPHGIPSLDLNLKCGGSTFEQAIMLLADLIFAKYGRKNKRDNI